MKRSRMVDIDFFVRMFLNLFNLSFFSNSSDKISEEKAAGKATQQVSRLLQDLAGIGSEIHSKHQSDIGKMKKSWDPFAEEALTND